MASDKEVREIQRQADALVKRISPILEGVDPDLQGFVCAELLAIHIAGWPAEMRAEMAAINLKMVTDLVPYHVPLADKLRNPKGRA